MLLGSHKIIKWLYKYTVKAKNKQREEDRWPLWLLFPTPPLLSPVGGGLKHTCIQGRQRGAWLLDLLFREELNLSESQFPHL